MRVTLMHAFAAMFTILLFVVRRRWALKGVTSAKRRSIQQVCNRIPWVPEDRIPQRFSVPCMSARVDRGLFLTDLTEPKYKRDPKIDFDHEENGSCDIE